MLYVRRRQSAVFVKSQFDRCCDRMQRHVIRRFSGHVQHLGVANVRSLTCQIVQLCLSRGISRIGDLVGLLEVIFETSDPVGVFNDEWVVGTICAATPPRFRVRCLRSRLHYGRMMR